MDLLLEALELASTVPETLPFRESDTLSAADDSDGYESSSSTSSSLSTSSSTSTSSTTTASNSNNSSAQTPTTTTPALSKQHHSSSTKTSRRGAASQSSTKSASLASRSSRSRRRAAHRKSVADLSSKDKERTRQINRVAARKHRKLQRQKYAELELRSTELVRRVGSLQLQLSELQQLRNLLMATIQERYRPQSQCRIWLKQAVDATFCSNRVETATC